eukprot:6107199-Amphidinium_carterae.1
MSLALKPKRWHVQTPHTKNSHKAPAMFQSLWLDLHGKGTVLVWLGRGAQGQAQAEMAPTFARERL